MDRRTLLGVIAGGLLTAPLAAQAQPVERMYRVGYLSTAANIFDPFRQALRELGYVEGLNVAMEVRLAAGRLDQLPALAADLVKARVDVIAAVSPPAIKAAKEATTTIPIVMAFASIDPVESGFVTSLARPSGNITGVMMIADEISGKRVALLKDMLPRATRIAVLTQVNHSSGTSQVKAARGRAEAVLVLGSPAFFPERKRLAELALRHRLPTSFQRPDYVEAGGLMSYGPDVNDILQRLADYTDLILKGAKPSDLPVEQPTKFELAINLKTAKAQVIE